MPNTGWLYLALLGKYSMNMDVDKFNTLLVDLIYGCRVARPQEN